MIIALTFTFLLLLTVVFIIGSCAPRSYESHSSDDTLLTEHYLIDDRLYIVTRDHSLACIAQDIPNAWGYPHSKNWLEESKLDLQEDNLWFCRYYGLGEEYDWGRLVQEISNWQYGQLISEPQTVAEYVKIVRGSATMQLGPTKWSAQANVAHIHKFPLATIRRELAERAYQKNQPLTRISQTFAK